MQQVQRYVYLYLLESPLRGEGSWVTALKIYLNADIWRCTMHNLREHVFWKTHFFDKSGVRAGRPRRPVGMCAPGRRIIYETSTGVQRGAAAARRDVRTRLGGIGGTRKIKKTLQLHGSAFSANTPLSTEAGGGRKITKH